MPLPSSAGRAVYRCHSRAQLIKDPGRMPDWEEAAKACRREAQKLVRDGRMMAAGLYIYGRQLFLYYEALGEAFGPEAFMRPMDGLLSPWPQKEETKRWAKMYPIYWHCEPKDEADWRRPKKPLRQRGRIAYLKHDAMFEYVYHHFAIVREGLLRGDKYMSIALHEDVLFSYFEEPRSCVNIRRTDEGESRAIRGWLDADPESHFVSLPGSEGQNFLLLPDVFTVGREI
ncbi:MAG: hypothetical protein IKQ41_12360 [Clostridia bacterium]|nr:hypothetical protein [Clostridia bacterium]